ncbi:hypothetical protein HML84_07745 [Alcanivorax sp. IO_7]|nr:hypothetical protein HML84_07745 [Alcanivorax sp. IO_7]
MALINGNFVVLGRGAELVFRLCDLVRRSLDNTARMLFVTHCDAVPFHVEKPSSRCWVVDVFRALEGWCVAPLAGFRQKACHYGPPRRWCKDCVTLWTIGYAKSIDC